MGRPKRGQRRIDAAIDALCPFGFPKTAIRKAITQLLNVYGGDDGWVFIEEASYKLVIEKLLEEAAEQEKKMQEEEANEVLPEEPNMQVAELPQENEIPDDAETQTMEVETQAMQVETLAIVPAVTIRKRPPCYGWISESESESDDEAHDAQENEAKCQSSGGLHRERKRPSGWDVRPSIW